MLQNSKGERIVYLNVLSENSIFNAFMIGQTLPNPSYCAFHKTSGNRTNDKYTFEYITAGRAYIDTKNKKYTVNKGDFMILNNNANHYYYTDKKLLLEKYFIVCNGTLVEKLMDLYNIRDKTYIRNIDFSAEFTELIKTIQENPEKANDSAALTVFKIMQRLYSLSEFKKVEDVPCHIRMAQYISENISFPIRIEDIAESFMVSESTVIRIFKENFNQTPKQYITEKRIATAKRLLSETKLSLSEISNYLSFSHQNNFSAFFTKITGISPSQYREQNPYLVNND